jgi:hypothetical protein
MRVRIEAGDGRSIRFKLVDMETGEKIGFVQEAMLEVTLKGERLRFIKQVINQEGNEPATFGPQIISPWLYGKYANDGELFYFEDRK